MYIVNQREETCLQRLRSNSRELFKWSFSPMIREAENKCRFVLDDRGGEEFLQDQSYRHKVPAIVYRLQPGEVNNYVPDHKLFYF